ncbi:MAG: ThuA domain-containing protein [Opitutales bacterium]
MRVISPSLRVLLVAALVSLLGHPAFAENYKILVFTKMTGFAHNRVEDRVAGITDLGLAHGFDVYTTEDSRVFVNGLADPDFPLLEEFAALVFLNTSEETRLGIDKRPNAAPLLEEDERVALVSYIQNGGGFVGIHAASDSTPETDKVWGWYTGLVGAKFLMHPKNKETPPAEFSPTTAPIRCCESSISHMAPVFSIGADQWVEEIYTFHENPLDVFGLEPLLYVDESTFERKGVLFSEYEDSHTQRFGVDPSEHPISWFQGHGSEWFREYGAGRSWYTALGHSADAFKTRDQNGGEFNLFMKHILGGIEYAAGIDTCLVTELSVPGEPIQAEGFDPGLNEATDPESLLVSYQDNTPGNTFPFAYFPVESGYDVDVGMDTNGVVFVGDVSENEWLTYTVDVAAAGDYILGATVASEVAGDHTFQLSVLNSDGTLTPLSSVLSLNTGVVDGESYTTIAWDGDPFYLSSGLQTLRLDFFSAGINIDSFELQPAPVATVVSTFESGLIPPEQQAEEHPWEYLSAKDSQLNDPAQYSLLNWDDPRYRIGSSIRGFYTDGDKIARPHKRRTIIAAYDVSEAGSYSLENLSFDMIKDASTTQISVQIRVYEWNEAGDQVAGEPEYSSEYIVNGGGGDLSIDALGLGALTENHRIYLLLEPIEHNGKDHMDIGFDIVKR